ncbi:hypothetical protein BCD49_28105 [Pseudofrankia sp. EUN1h]|nr:hypothetical protein BCD49_28105 [Pseudofrankia sp. EUN1h]
MVTTDGVLPGRPPKGDITTDGGTAMKATYRAPALQDVGSFRERTHGFGLFGFGFGGWGWGHGWGWGWGGGWGHGGGWGGWC